MNTYVSEATTSCSHLAQRQLLSMSLQSIFISTCTSMCRDISMSLSLLPLPAFSSEAQEAEVVPLLPQGLHFLDSWFFVLSLSRGSTSASALPLLSRLEGFLHIVCSQHSCFCTSSVRLGFFKPHGITHTYTALTACRPSEGAAV